MKKRQDNAAFTMLEVLTVMAVIAIIASMSFPILARARKSAQNAAAADLCSQVAAAWNTLLIDNRRFPSEDLVKACIDGKSNFGDCKTVDGDLVFTMCPGVSSLLNWWTRQTPIPQADRKKFAPTYANGPRKGKEISHSPGDDGAFVQNWPADTRLERDVAQKRLGVFAPWIKVPSEILAEDESGAEKKYSVLDIPNEALVQYLEDQFGFSMSDMVVAAIDLDGDGHVPVAVSLTGDDAEIDPSGVEKIPASTAAWIFRKEKKGRTKLIKSW